MDPEVVRRARDGDRAAFATLVTASIDGLDRVARLMTRDPDRAQDAVQEALVKAGAISRRSVTSTGSRAG